MRKLALFSLVVVLFISCKKTTIAELPVATMDLEGFVFLHNEFGQYQKSNAGVTVSLDNTSYSTTTDSLGKYVIKQIPAKYYDITFSKSGYGTYKQHEYYTDSLNGKTYQRSSLDLYVTPTSVITNLAAHIDQNNVVITGTISPAGSRTERRGVVLFSTILPNVSSTNYTKSQAVVFFVDSSSFSFQFPASDFFSPPDTNYFVAYGIAANPIGGSVTPYYDFTNQVTIPSALSPVYSNITSIVLP